MVGACPYRDYNTPADATLPPLIGAALAPGTFCFNDNGGVYVRSVVVRALNCGAFAMWWLPPLMQCTEAYCLGQL
eukprot:SAG22_NODE_1010_length_6043_cov_2.870962_2_plen_75_part_00